MTIGERIRHRRSELGLTLLEVADAIGVREATVQRYESGNIKNLKQDTISNLADALKTTPAYLMGWEDSEPTDIIISNNIKKYRERMGVSKQVIADFVGVAVSQIDEWESGNSYPSLGHVEKLCSALSISLDDLRSTPNEKLCKWHEEDYLSDLFHSNGFSIFFATTGSGTTVIIGNETDIYELSTEDFEDFKKSVREYVRYKLFDTIKGRNPLVKNFNSAEPISKIPPTGCNQ